MTVNHGEGSYDAVADHLRCLRKGLQPPASAAVAKDEANGSPKGSRYESQEAARLLMLEGKEPEALRPEQSRWLEELRQRSPELAQIQDLAGRFAKIIREGAEDKLGGWLKVAEGSRRSGPSPGECARTRPRSGRPLPCPGPADTSRVRSVD